MTAHTLPGVPEPDQERAETTPALPAWAAARDTRLPEVEYIVLFVDEEQGFSWVAGKKRWANIAEVLLPSEHAGKRVMLYTPMPKHGNPIARGSDIFKIYNLATGGSDRLPPMDWKAEGVSPFSLLSSKLWRVSVCTVKESWRREPLPEGLWYSRVDQIIEHAVDVEKRALSSLKVDPAACGDPLREGLGGEPSEKISPYVPSEA